MIDYDELKNKKKASFENANKSICKLNEIAEESGRVAMVAKNAERIINNLDINFKEATSLNDFDVNFLFFAVALQCIRQYFITGFKTRTGHIESAKEAHKNEKDIFGALFKDKCNEEHTKYYATLDEIITNGVPYDTIYGAKEFELGLSGNSHRFRTLGHDPILGWVFGTANIITSTLTDWKFHTYHVATMPKLNGILMPKIIEDGNTLTMIEKTISRSQSEPEILAAAIIKQGLHYKSDVLSKAGLPMPFISTISPDFSQQLAEHGVDICNALDVGKQASLSILINTMVSMIYGLYYDVGKYGTWDVYSMKIRKIIEYSNIISSSSNIAYVTITHQMSKLDIGGFLVTLYSIVSNAAFIRNTKELFLKNEWYNLVMDNNYRI